MSALWVVACAILLAAFALCGVRALRGEPAMRVVGLQLASVLAIWLVLALARLASQSSFAIVAFGLVLTSFVGGLAFVRYLEHRL